MRPVLFLASLCVFAAPPEPPPLDGKSLPPVPGPLVTDELPDLSWFPGPRDLSHHIRAQARRSPWVPAVAVPAGSQMVEDRVPYPAGWKTYRVDVPAGATLQARLHGTHEAWFVVRVLNRWGRLERGMLQNKIWKGIPAASYINPKHETSTVFFVVDSTEREVANESFTLRFSLP